MNYQKLTPKQVSDLRGRYKAGKRSTAMWKRNLKYQEQAEHAYQVKLVRDLQRYL